MNKQGGLAQWVARLTRDREFKPHQSPPLFH